MVAHHLNLPLDVHLIVVFALCHQHGKSRLCVQHGVLALASQLLDAVLSKKFGKLLDVIKRQFLSNVRQ